MPQHNPNLFICGHSHILKVQEDKKYNLWSINPGACGREGFHVVKTALKFTLDDAKLQHFEIIDLGKRAKI
jgi:predicted phosphodiesterase